MTKTDYPFAIIKPVAFRNSMLTATTLPEIDPPAWVGGAHLPGDIVSMASTQLCYECLIANTGAAPDQNITGDTPKWKVSLTQAMAWTAGGSRLKGGRARLPGTHKVYQCLVAHLGTTGGSAAVAISIAAPGVITWNAHGFAANTEVTFSTTGALPSGLVAGATYYVLAPTANSFNVSATPGGAAIATTGTQSGTHTATVASTSPDVSSVGDNRKWQVVGATNAYAMFDDKWGTQAVAMHSMTFVMAPGQVVDSLALLNLLGNQVEVTCTVAGEVIYTKTIALQTDIGVYDWKSYFIAPIVAQDDVVLTDLLPYYQQAISITITGPGVVGIGNAAIGQFINLGLLEASPKAGIISYSKKTVDDYGGIVVTPRGYAKRFGGRVIIESKFADQCAAILAQIRDIPVVWIGAGNLYSCLIVWGFFKDFEIDIAYSYDSISYCTLTVEGLV